MTDQPCQCPDCQRFYREHDRLIREFPTLKQQQELNWASIQSFRTLCTKVTEELKIKLENQDSEKDINDICFISKEEISDAINDLENINAHLYSIETLMEKIFDVKVSENIERRFKDVAKEIAPDPLNMDRLLLNRIFHQTTDFPDKNNNENKSS